MPRYSDAQREDIRKIVHWACALAHRNSDIVRFLADKGYHLQSRQVTNYISEAMAEIRAAGRVDRDHMRGEAITRLRQMLRDALGDKRGDRRLALAIQREIDVLGGLVVNQHIGAKSFEDWLKSEGEGGGDAGSPLPPVPGGEGPDDNADEPFISAPEGGAAGEPGGDGSGGDGAGQPQAT